MLGRTLAQWRLWFLLISVFRLVNGGVLKNAEILHKRMLDVPKSDSLVHATISKLEGYTGAKISPNTRFRPSEKPVNIDGDRPGPDFVKEQGNANAHTFGFEPPPHGPQPAGSQNYKQQKERPKSGMPNFYEVLEFWKSITEPVYTTQGYAGPIASDLNKADKFAKNLQASKRKQADQVDVITHSALLDTHNERFFTDTRDQQLIDYDTSVPQAHPENNLKSPIEGLGAPALTKIAPSIRLALHHMPAINHLRLLAIRSKQTLIRPDIIASYRQIATIHTNNLDSLGGVNSRMTGSIATSSVRMHQLTQQPHIRSLVVLLSKMHNKEPAVHRITLASGNTKIYVRLNPEVSKIVSGWLTQISSRFPRLSSKRTEGFQVNPDTLLLNAPSKQIASLENSKAEVSEELGKGMVLTHNENFGQTNPQMSGFLPGPFKSLGDINSRMTSSISESSARMRQLTQQPHIRSLVVFISKLHNKEPVVHKITVAGGNAKIYIYLSPEVTKILSGWLTQLLPSKFSRQSGKHTEGFLANSASILIKPPSKPMASIENPKVKLSEELGNSMFIHGENVQMNPQISGLLPGPSTSIPTKLFPQNPYVPSKIASISHISNKKPTLQIDSQRIVFKGQRPITTKAEKTGRNTHSLEPNPMTKLFEAVKKLTGLPSGVFTSLFGNKAKSVVEASESPSSYQASRTSLMSTLRTWSQSSPQSETRVTSKVVTEGVVTGGSKAPAQVDSDLFHNTKLILSPFLRPRFHLETLAYLMGRRSSQSADRFTKQPTNAANPANHLIEELPRTDKELEKSQVEPGANQMLLTKTPDHPDPSNPSINDDTADQIEIVRKPTSTASAGEESPLKMIPEDASAPNSMESQASTTKRPPPLAGVADRKTVPPEQVSEHVSDSHEGFDDPENEIIVNRKKPSSRPRFIPKWLVRLQKLVAHSFFQFRKFLTLHHRVRTSTPIL